MGIYELDTIKRTAKQVGLSEATLRKYEKYGIVHPIVKESGYRFYDGLNISRLISSKRFRQCGFSLKQTAELLNHTDLNNISHALEQRIQEIQQDLLWQQKLLSQMNHMQKEIAEFLTPQNKYEIVERPNYYYLDKQDWEKLPDQSEIVKQWTDLLPIAHLTVLIEQNTENPTLYESSFGYTIPEDSLDLLQLDEQMNIPCIPSGKFLTTVIECSTDLKYLSESIPNALHYLQQQQLTYAFPIFMDTIVCTGSHDEIKAFRRCWIRIVEE